MTDNDTDNDPDEDQDQDRMARADRIRSRRGSRSPSGGSETTGSGEDRKTDQTTRSSQPAQSSQPSQSAMSSQSEQREQKRPVKERPHRTIYLPETLDEELETLLDTILFEAKTKADTELGKNRHAYPLVMYIGIERAQDMSIEDLLDILEDTPMLDDPTN